MKRDERLLQEHSKTGCPMVDFTKDFPPFHAQAWALRILNQVNENKGPTPYDEMADAVEIVNDTQAILGPTCFTVTERGSIELTRGYYLQLKMGRDQDAEELMATANLWRERKVGQRCWRMINGFIQAEPEFSARMTPDKAAKLIKVLSGYPTPQIEAKG